VTATEAERQTPNAERRDVVPSRIADAFARCKAEGRTALIPFVTGGYPDMETAEQTLVALAEAGADLIEIGVPFSDPLADGTTVQRTSQVALSQGTRLVDCIDLARRARENHGVTAPIVLMGYYNPFYQLGLEHCAAECAKAGVDGFIVPDLPAEESDDFIAACRAHNRDLVFLVAPTSTDTRLQDIATKASGFIYCVSLTGVTGARDRLWEGLPGYIARVRATTDLPLAIGFGISTPAHVQQAGELSDGAVVASALINYLDRFDTADYRTAATAYMRYLRGEADLPEPGAT
jgi:tryptophan synthase alpha chain